MAQTTTSIFNSMLRHVNDIVRLHLMDCRNKVLRYSDLAKAIGAWATVFGIEVSVTHEISGPKRKRPIVAVKFAVKDTDLCYSLLFPRGLAGHFPDQLAFYCPNVHRPKDVAAPISIQSVAADWWHIFFSYLSCKDSKIFGLRFRTHDIQNIYLAIDAWTKKRINTFAVAEVFASKIWAKYTWDSLRSMYKSPAPTTDSCSSNDSSETSVYAYEPDLREDEASEAHQS